MAFTLGIMVCLASGFALVSLFSSRTVTALCSILFKLTLSVGFGLGMFSVIFFLGRVSSSEKMTCNVEPLGPKRLGLIAFDGVVLAFLIAAVSLRRKRSAAPTFPLFPSDENWPRWFRRVLVAATYIALCGAMYAAIMQARAHPQGGGWDAFAIWNLHARFLFLGGSHWRNGFSSLIPWSHPDYPLLIPASIAHLWTLLGYDDPYVPAAVAVVLTFGTVGLLFSSLSMLRGRITPMLAALVLLTTPFFVEQGTWQYADVPLAFFFLATIALLAMHDETLLAIPEQHPSGFLALAGVAAGFAAWTKNEGILFVCAIILARLMVFQRRYRKSGEPNPPFSHDCAAFLLGCVPLVLLIVYFKRWIAPVGNLFTSPASMLHRLLEPARFETVIGKAFVHGFFTFGDWLGIPGTLLLLAFYFIAGRRDQRRPTAGHRASILALSLTSVGYLCVYLITPYNLFWHLRFSLDRLLLQLWPSTIFLFFLLFTPQNLSK
jgi:hypothetical protein